MERLQAFRKEYSRAVEQLPGVTEVEFIGSIANGNFVPGKSDLDVFVHGDQKIPQESRRQAVALVRELNAKYRLGLESAPCQHPTPFIIDTSFRRAIYRLLVGRFEARLFRATMKRIAPSYGLIWRLQQRGGKL